MGKSRKNHNPMNPAALFLRYADNNGLKWTRNRKRKAGDKKAPVGRYTVYKFKCDCKEAKWNEWESADVFAANGENCDNPKCSDKPPVQPCQGPILSPTPCVSTPGRFQGKFQCPNFKCRNLWASRYAYARMHQACQLCGYHAYSYHMVELEKRNRLIPGESGPHDSANCGMCQIDPAICAAARGGRGDGNRYFIKNSRRAAKEPREPANIPGPDGFIEVINRRRRRNVSGMSTTGEGAQQKEEQHVIKEMSPPPQVEDGFAEMIERLKSPFKFEGLSIE